MRRTEDPNVIEHRLLELAYTTESPITATTLAYFAPSSIEDAEKVLDNLVARDRIHMEVRDDGQIEYLFPNRHKLEALKERPRTPHPELALVRHQLNTPIAIRNGRTASPLLAGALSLLIPGAGQVYTGNFLSAILWFVLVSAGYTLILPGLFLHLFCIAAAASSAHRLNSTLARLQLEAGH